MTTCQGIFGLLFGHRFEPRYDSIPPDGRLLQNFEGHAGAIKVLLNGLTKEIYRGDVCTRCGEIRNQVKEGAPQ